MSERFTHREVGGDAAPLNGGTPKGKRRGQPAPVALWASTARGRALGRWATACCAAVVLAGCSGESAPTASSGDVAPSDMSRIASGNASSSKTTSAPSSTSSNTNGQSREFVVPDAAKAHTHEGAKAFVKFYWETLGSLDKRPKSGVIPRLSAGSCEACKMQEEAVRALLHTDAHYEVKSDVISRLTVRPDSTADSVVVRFHERSTGRVRVEGEERSAEGDIDQDSAMRVDWTPRGWVIGEVGAK